MKPTFQPQKSYRNLQGAFAAILLTLISLNCGTIISASALPNTNTLNYAQNQTALQSRLASRTAAFGTQKTKTQNVTATGFTRPPRATRDQAIVAEVGPNHRSWSNVKDENTSTARVSGQAGSVGNSTTRRAVGPQVVEITTGMNFWDGQQWSPSDASFELTDDAFVADRVQHRTRLSADLNVIGAVTMTLQDGTTLRSTPVAIALYDPNDGRFAVISTITNSTGILVESNQVMYPDAFTGGVCASVIYTLQKGSFEQDVVITGRLNPLDYAFPTNAQIQVVTEFYDAPQPEKLRRPIYVEAKETVRRSKVSPDLVDEVLGFSDLVFGTGRAYTLPSAANTNGTQTVVAKEFKTVPDDGRTYLIETVNCLSIQKELNSLPECEGGVKTAQMIRGSKARDGYAFIPKPNPTTLVKIQPRRYSFQLAQVENPLRTGVVIDYFATLTPLNGTFVFKGDTTYLVAGTVYFNGPVTLEAAVLKYKSGAKIVLNSTINCKTSSYRPAIFTGLDDESVGESLGGLDPDWTGTINPSGYADPAIWSYWQSAPNLSNVRFSYAKEAIRVEGGTVNATIAHSQIIRCIRGIVLVSAEYGSGGSGSSGFRISVNNSLFSFVNSALISSAYGSGSGAPAAAYLTHCTVADSQFLAYGALNFSVAFTNSVLANIGTLGTAFFGGTHNGFSSAPLFGAAATRWTATDPFQTSGSGAYYLKADSIFRGKGTTAGIPAGLLDALRAKSTQPPIIFPRFMEVAGELTLFPQTPRYVSGPPDLGYWYDALDYTVAAMFVKGGTITVQPGTAVGFRNEYAPDQFWPWYWSLEGFDLWEGSSFISHGTPTRPNVFADVQTVQEQPSLATYAFFVPYFLSDSSQSPAPVADFRFSNFYAAPGASPGYAILSYFEWPSSYVSPGSYHFWSGANEWDESLSANSTVELTLRDCSLQGGAINLGKTLDSVVNPPNQVAWINNLFDRVDLNLDPDWVDHGDPTLYVDMAFKAYNNLFRGGRLCLVPIPATAGNWIFKDNLFDKIAFEQDSAQTLDHNFNGYWKRGSGELEAGQTDRLTPNGANDKVLATAPPYQVGPLGNYYLAISPLYNGGSRTAADAGLFHYTTQVNQTKEGSEGAGNMVNISLHYVATANSSSTTPKDSDTDGIADFVEDANGDGVWDEGWETKVNDAYTITEPMTHDSVNVVYDDIDLDGDGMVGRIEKALTTNPLISDNPLMVEQVVEEETGIFSFKVPVSQALLASIGGLNLNVDGAAATLDELAASGDGKCLLLWNTTFDRPGQRFLQPQLGLLNPGSDEAILLAAGPIHPFYSDNVLQFFEAGSMFDDLGAYLDAELPVLNATYTIQLYDPSTTPPTLIRTIGPNTTWSGVIQEDWNVTYADESPFSGDTVEAVFNVTILDESATPIASGISTRILSQSAGALTAWGPNFAFAYMYTPHDGSLASAFAKNGVVWNGMQSVVDALIAPRWPWDVYGSAFNRYLPDSCGEYPGYVTRRSTPPTPSCVWTEISIEGNLLPDLAIGSTKQFYCYAHGDPSGVAVNNATGDVYIRRDEISSRLGNTVNVRGELQTRNPYRFVFLDTCHSARSARWAQAFGIARLGPTRNKVGPQAFVGWASSHGTGLTTHADFGQAYTATLRAFYVLWMSGHPLASCIDFASEYTFLDNPFPVRGNEMIEVNGLRGIRNTCDIYVVGHSGLTVSGLNQSWDKRYQPPYQY